MVLQDDGHNDTVPSIAVLCYHCCGDGAEQIAAMIPTWPALSANQLATEKGEYHGKGFLSSCLTR